MVSLLIFRAFPLGPDPVKIRYHPQSGWFDEGPSKGPPPVEES